jgi:uncharacterized phage protein gp47/JayE
MSTPPYAPPSIGPAGLTINTYPSILADNLQAYLNIFGLNQYVAPDSAIYQLLSIISLKQSDANLGLQLAYNQASPQTAVGAGLDRIVKMNGLARSSFTYSTAILTITGSATAVLVNCFAQDQNGNLWSIPSPLPITGGAVDVVAVCTTPGNVTAEPNSINIKATPSLGWTSVNNAAPATSGDPVETDSELRARQAISVALPSRTTLQTTIASVLAVAGVTRVAPGYPTPGGPGTSIENPTGATDSWGNPPHSISMVVEGGTDAAVAQAIYGARGIGCYTNGTTAVVVVDPNSGYSMTISFFRPTYIPIAVLVAVTPLAGFTSSTLAAIQAGIVNYLNSLSIGETVVYSELYGAALTARPNPDQPIFSIASIRSAALSAQTTGNLVLGSPNVVVASVVGLANGMLVVDETNPAALPDGVMIINISGSTVTLSANAFQSQTGDSLSFFALGTSDIAMPNYYDAVVGLDSNVQVA